MRSPPSGTATGTTAKAAGTAAPGSRPSTRSAPARPAAPAPQRAHGRACRPRGATAARLTHPAHHPARSAPPAGCWRWAPATSTPAPGGRPSTSTSPAPARPAAPAPRREEHPREAFPGAFAVGTAGAAGTAVRMSASAFAIVHPPREQPREQPPGQREQQRQEGRPSTRPAPARPAAPAPRRAHGRACRPRGAAAARLTHPARHPPRSAPLRPAAGAGRRPAQHPRPETRKPARGRLRWRQGAAAPGVRTAAPPGPCSTSPSYRQGSAGCASGGPPHGQGARHPAAPQPRQPRSSPCR